MKIKTAFIIVLFALAGCSGIRSTLGPGSTPSTEKAVIVGKVILNPSINEDGDKAQRNDNLLEHQTVFTKGDGSFRGQDPDNFFDEEFDVIYEDTPSGTFFAIEIEPQDKVSLNGLFFYVERTSFFFADKYYSSNLRQFMITADEKIKAGKSYYIGTIKIDLAKKSFKETGDDEYDMNELNYVIPQNITVIDEYSSAKKWFGKNYKNAAPLIKAKVKKRNVKTKSVYTETVVY